MPNLDLVICPGCGIQLPKENTGCPSCGYQNPDNGRLLTINELMAHPNFPEDGALCLNDVSAGFIRAIVEAASKA